MCRTLWPEVTESAASDAFLTAWHRQEALEVREDEDGGGPYAPDADLALGHLLAHRAYRVNPAGELPEQFSVTAGEVGSIGEGSASVGASTQSANLSQGGEDYSTTPPGRAWLAFKARKLRAARLVAG